MPSFQLVLASSSPYRKALLERLGLPFKIASPNVDETPRSGENPAELAMRLAIAKAKAVAPAYPASQIIGSDQVALLGNEILGKPGNHANATQQLKRMSGQSLTFLTAVCLHDSATHQTSTRLVPIEVRFRELDDRAIECYLLRDRPYDCAGSAKAESLGIALIEWMHGDDPNALIGLPLIALVDLLNEHGINVL